MHQTQGLLRQSTTMELTSYNRSGGEKSTTYDRHAVASHTVGGEMLWCVSSVNTPLLLIQAR